MSLDTSRPRLGRWLAARRSRFPPARSWEVLLLLGATTLFVVTYYANNPSIEGTPDTESYLNAARHIMSDGQFVDPVRTPGYPLLISLVFTMAGHGNLLALSIAQAVLFVVAIVEIYVITYLIVRRGWIALFVGLIAGTNTYLLSYTKPIMVEGFALFAVVSLTLATVLFVRRPRPGAIWFVTACTLLAIMTRAEWALVPLPLFGFLKCRTRRLHAMPASRMR